MDELTKNIRINALNRTLLRNHDLCKLESLSGDKLKEHLERNVWGYVIDRGGPHGMDIESPIFAFNFMRDEGILIERGNACLVIKKSIGGFAILRYANRNVVIGREAVKYAKEKLLPFVLNNVE